MKSVKRRLSRRRRWASGAWRLERCVHHAAVFCRRTCAAAVTLTHIAWCAACLGFRSTALAQHGGRTSAAAADTADIIITAATAAAAAATAAATARAARCSELLLRHLRGGLEARSGGRKVFEHADARARAHQHAAIGQLYGAVRMAELCLSGSAVPVHPTPSTGSSSSPATVLLQVGAQHSDAVVPTVRHQHTPTRQPHYAAEVIEPRR